LKITFLSFAITALPLMANATGPSISVETGFTSTAIDRGEQIGGPAHEGAVFVELPFGSGTAYGGVYRLTPIGPDQAAFPDEVDYFAGYVFSAETVEVDLSANWLTFPGDADESSLEIVASAVLDAPFSPSMTSFYDVDLEDWGIEVAAGPSATLGTWTLGLLGRAGFVDPGDGSASRSYFGVEADATHPLGQTAEGSLFARFEIADEDAFADSISGGDITRADADGFAIGVNLRVGL